MPPRAKKPPATGETLLPSEVKAQRELAEAAGYVSPYPAEGQALVATIEDRCGGCRWTLYVSMRNDVWCANPKCTEYGVLLMAEDVAS